MKKFVSMLLALVMVFALCACGSKTEGGDKAESKIKVGFICLHDENSTYDKNFIDAAKAACKNAGLSEDQYIIKTNIPEGQECYNAAAELVDAGCNVVFADSFGHEDFMIQAAKEFKDVQFCHATGTKAHTEKLSNYHNAFASIYEGRYLAGVAAGMKLNEIMDGFSGGAKNAANIALIVGIARSIQVVLENGKIMDTVIYYLSSPLQGMSPILAAIAITVIVGIVHFFIPSGSGIAVAMMPIIGPVAMTLGLTAQTAVLAFQVGATVPNFILPTVGAYVAMCSIARVPVNKWWKFGWRLTIPLYVLSWVFVVIAVLINYGPF